MDAKWGLRVFVIGAIVLGNAFFLSIICLLAVFFSPLFWWWLLLLFFVDIIFYYGFSRAWRKEDQEDNVKEKKESFSWPPLFLGRRH